MNKEGILEGLLFVVGEDGLSIDEICEILDIKEEVANSLIDTLKGKYASETSGFSIQYLGNTYKLTTKAEHVDFYRELAKNTRVGSLTQATLETLAIIAYNTPITRVKIDEIRGVSSAHLVRKLVALDFIEDDGREDSVGKPILYKTTNKFLDYFGLSSIEELPSIDEFTLENLEEDLDLYETR
jgi:segregation and condensation protein B